MPVELSFDPKDPKYVEFLQRVPLLSCLDNKELKTFAGLLKQVRYETGEVVYSENHPRDTVYFVLEGKLSFNKGEHTIRFFNPDECFGEYTLINESPHTSSVRALMPTILLQTHVSNLKDQDKFPATAYGKLCKQFALILTTRPRHEEEMYREIDVLLIQDGGCSPGYNSVTAFLTEYLEKAGRRVFAAAEGFKSLITGEFKDFRRLVYTGAHYKDVEGFHGVMFVPPLREARGAEFRTERFPEFKELEYQKKAAENLLKRKVRVIIGIGGNGTLGGMQSLGKLLPSDVQLFFVPVTIDSDIYGTECIGEQTAVEVGAEKISGYMADARTHHRSYIIEMMGREGGYHALHSCLGAGAHLAVLPDSRYDMERVARAIEKRASTVIVVAEGYMVKERRAQKYKGSAADFFYDELKAAGLNTTQRIVCEAFSRDIRGARPNNRDITLAHRMAKKVAFLTQTGQNRMMPAVLAGQEYAINFDDIRTQNTVPTDLAVLSNRLGV